MTGMPIAALSTGARVANFSSPHVFTFTDGTILAKCEDERSERLMLRSVEEEKPRGLWVDLALNFEMSAPVMEALQKAWGLWADLRVDVVLVPFPVMEALKRDGRFGPPTEHPFRTVRMADRVKKIVHHDRFCC